MLVKVGTLIVVIVMALTGRGVSAQHETAADIEDGGRVFRDNCANCHGPDGDEVAGVDLGRGQFRGASSDADLIQIIRNGIPGTPMPASNFSEEQAARVVAYLRSIARSKRGGSAVGDISRGKALFESKGTCVSCHRVNGNGARLGPDLSAIGQLRRAVELERSVLDPDEEVLGSNRSYRAVTRDGATITGRLLNLDTFTIQLLDSREQLRSFVKSDLREHGFIDKSPMPSYRDTLDAQELADLVSYLASLKGKVSPVLAASLQAQRVTFDRLLHPDREPHNWLGYSGTVFNERYSPLTQITPANVKNLELQWLWQAKSLEKFEATALAVDGVLYTVQGPPVQGSYEVVALDAVTGRLFWTFTYQPALEARPCCGRVSRGLSILGDTLFLGTIDAHLLAIDAKTGKAVWDTEAAKASDRYAITHAPLVVKDKVIVGMAGGDMGVRGFIAAFDAKTGQEVWRFYTIPGPGEPGNESWSGDSWKTGGAGVWNSGAYDAQANLIYFGTGNPAPDWDGRQRLGDNLYSDSVVALDADTGKLRWHYQFTPHDEVDYDSTQVPILVDMEWQGRSRNVMLWANRNGLAYVLDRLTGEFLLGKPFVRVNWMEGFDKNGRPMRVPGKIPTPDGELVMPTVLGATNWAPASYSPRTGLFYVSLWENTGTVLVEGGRPRPAGVAGTGGTPMGQATLTPNTKKDAEGYGAIRALDPKTLEAKWEFKMNDITWGGVLTTASNLVFSGGKEGYFLALDARTGALLWKVSLGGQINSGPMSYSVNGRQYITVAAGNALFAFALRQ